MAFLKINLSIVVILYGLSNTFVLNSCWFSQKVAGSFPENFSGFCFGIYTGDIFLKTFFYWKRYIHCHTFFLIFFLFCIIYILSYWFPSISLSLILSQKKVFYTLCWGDEESLKDSLLVFTLDKWRKFNWESCGFPWAFRGNYSVIPEAAIVDSNKG